MSEIVEVTEVVIEEPTDKECIPRSWRAKNNEELDLLAREFGRLLAALPDDVRVPQPLESQRHSPPPQSLLRDMFQDLVADYRFMRQSLVERKLVERAKGILMSQYNLPESEAFRRLQQLASKNHLRLAEAAERVLQVAAVAPPRGASPAPLRRRRFNPGQDGRVEIPATPPPTQSAGQ